MKPGKMLMKLAIWYLRKKEVSVILNCKFYEPIEIGTKRYFYIADSEYVENTKVIDHYGNKWKLEL